MKPAYYIGLAALALLIFKPVKLKALPVIGRLTSPFGKRKNPVTGKEELHNGIDLAAAVDTPIKAPADAVIDKIYTTPKGGLQAILKHADGYRTGYAHLEKVIYPAGTKIERGVVWARVGKSGAVTGAHLHLTLRNPKGELINPATYFDIKGAKG